MNSGDNTDSGTVLDQWIDRLVKTRILGQTIKLPKVRIDNYLSQQVVSIDTFQPCKASEVSSAFSNMDENERPMSPSPKRQKVQPDYSVPSTSAGKVQQKINSYGVNGVNREKFHRQNPHDGPVLNEKPIEVNLHLEQISIMFQRRYKFSVQ